MYFFLTLNKNGDVGYFPAGEKDRLPPGICCLKRPLPLGLIQNAQDWTNKRKKGRFWGSGLKERQCDRVKSELCRLLNGQEWNVPKLSSQEDFVTSDCQLASSIDGRELMFQAFDELVLGRQLSWGELKILARELRCEAEIILAFAHLNVERNMAEWVPAVVPQGKGWQCQRCGERNIKEWPSYYGRAGTCLSCKTLGPSTSLEAFYRDHRPLLKGQENVNFYPHWPLTEAQNLASGQVLAFLNNSAQPKALLWAACGSGKTEVCFPSAARALEEGKSVLFAAPRQDVIHDVAPRLKRDFPGVPIQVLTGSVPIRYQRGNLVLATTHQVLRFWQAFDVIFLDEMDAFPYQGSEALEWGLTHALRPKGKLIYLTATPSLEALKEVRRGNMLLIRLPARHHRYPLPIPVVEKYRNPFDPKSNLLSLNKARFESIRQAGRILVFVPKISWIQPWVNCFRRYFPDWKIEGSYSSDKERFDKISDLRQGKFDLFVSTTILERGITLEGIQVVVLGAEHPIFDERALVQMAGRVGRTRENPSGTIVFMSCSNSTAMKTAIQWIKDQNRLALKQGLIDLRT
ncbi:superfamily II DNA/RNA helicase required for DNA uptake (late competence protein) [Desulfosporosinus acidiphilus SJ4]|uniref:Superfamily II DNA/RNA helicase required for DNA uptake (Late competence protein) n=2 Tax=Desulfosporosinus TaxID=79206 RepID=I4DCC4_DESAJ|nr:superfamily II DNA/RNA helicase required for DNA uptake (late competence protein) [Desulfosporosinus acidiphilus SJ4]